MAPRGFLEISRRNLWGKNRAVTLFKSVGHIAVHFPVPEYSGLITSIAYPYSPSEIPRGPSYRFNSPDGHVFELYWETNKYAAPEAERPALKNIAQPVRTYRLHRASGDPVGAAPDVPPAPDLPWRGTWRPVSGTTTGSRCPMRSSTWRAMGGHGFDRFD